MWDAAPSGGRNGVTRPELKCSNIIRLHRRFGPRGQTPSLSHSVPMPAFEHPKEHYGQLCQPILSAGVPSCGGTPGRSHSVGVGAALIKN